MAQLSNWVLEAVIKQIADWNQAGIYPQITVNLSPLDIRRKNLAQLLSKMLQEYQVEPQYLVVEITESEELLDTNYAVSQLQAIKESGVGIILDDFGTGFSSISHLLNLPINAAKIDKSFVKNLDQEASNQFLQGIIDLIQGSGVKTVVEGVETSEQFQRISSMGYIFCQGYLFAKPMPPEELIPLLEKGAFDLSSL